ncbi:hypothetical protein ACSVH2_06775 [Flavobacterium sp. RSB2_4_14]|uniref:hypothetical protein n=1 Tax=Flavobacterium sp. RSB2_4_14 TaxID=3447665 RepID=UPI003F3C88E2
MKKIIILVFLISSLLTFSQQITYTKGKFYVKGEQISTRETQKLLATNVKSATLFKQAKSKESLGGFLLGFGIGLTVGDLAIGLFSDKDYPSALTYVGVSSIAVSIPILSGRKKKIEEAIDIYNKENPNNTLGFHNKYSVNAITNQNGLGFQINF